MDYWKVVKSSLRLLRKSPGFTIAAVAALALGIGANTAIFSVVNAVLLKPLSYPEADRMVNFLAPSTAIANDLHNIPEFQFLGRQTSLFKALVAFDIAGPGFNLTGGSRPQQVNGIHVTQAYFRMFGAPVVLGRTFTPQEDAPHGGKVVVLSYGLWQRVFGGDAGAGPISEAVNLYAVALRTGKKLVYDAGSQKITNLAEANKYLIRSPIYRGEESTSRKSQEGNSFVARPSASPRLRRRPRPIHWD